MDQCLPNSREVNVIEGPSLLLKTFYSLYLVKREKPAPGSRGMRQDPLSASDLGAIFSFFRSSDPPSFRTTPSDFLTRPLSPPPFLTFRSSDLPSPHIPF